MDNSYVLGALPEAPGEAPASSSSALAVVLMKSVQLCMHAFTGDPAYEAGFAFLKKFIGEHREELPLILWKDTSPQHFEYDNGYFWWVALPGHCAACMCLPLQHLGAGAEKLLWALVILKRHAPPTKAKLALRTE